MAVTTESLRGYDKLRFPWIREPERERESFAVLVMIVDCFGSQACRRATLVGLLVVLVL